MRNIIIDVEARPRPSLVTPAKGSSGDRVDESQAVACSIDVIIKRYGGMLPACRGWEDGGVQLPLNRDELEAMAYDACENIVNSGDSPFASVDEAISALSDGTFASKIRDHKTEPVKTEPVKTEPVKTEPVNKEE